MEPKIIYQAYLTDHFRIVQETLFHLIEEYENSSAVFSEFDDLDKEDIVKSYMLEMKMNTYHSIETLFELLFGLTNEKNDPNDYGLWLTLSKGNKGNIGKIEDFADDATKFDFDIKINNKTIPFLQHAIYFGNLGFDHKDKVEESIPLIKRGLKILANIFKDREVYNSYKHGLRLFQTLSRMRAIDKEKDKTIMDLDFSKSVSFLKHDKGQSCFHLKVKNIDYKKEHTLSLFAYSLISNIMKSRRIGAQYSEKEEFYFYNKDLIDELLDVNIRWDDFTQKCVYKYA